MVNAPKYEIAPGLWDLYQGSAANMNCRPIFINFLQSTAVISHPKTDLSAVNT